MNRDLGISLLRVCAMLMICLSHFTRFLEISWMAQFLNVGVYVFLLISGWLYSTRRIAQPAEWLRGRWKKLCVPVLVWVLLVIPYEAFVRHELPRGLDVLLFATNLQGLSWVLMFFPGIDLDGALGGLGNLWFVTVIMLCYMLMLLVKRLEGRGVGRRRALWGVGGLLAFFALSAVRINLIYFLCFLLGYGLGKEKRELSGRGYAGVTAAMVLAIALRLTAKHYFDDTLFYLVDVVGLTHTAIALWIFYTVWLAAKRIGFVRALAATGLIRTLDDFSYYIYITHNFFLTERFGLKAMVPGLALQTLLFCALTVATALAVKWLSNRLLSLRAARA